MSLLKVGVVMDPVESIKPWKDSTLAMMLEAQRRNYVIYSIHIEDVYMDAGISHACYRALKLTGDNQH